jgi:hypothetical protein
MTDATTTDRDKTVSLSNGTDDVEQLIDRRVREEVDRRLGDLEDRVADLADRLDETADRTARDAADDRRRIYELEERVDTLEKAASEAGSEASHPEGDGGEERAADTSDRPQTPLERVVTVPDHMATDELTANVGRARFIARGVMDYTRDVPAGRALRSSELRRVLVAGTDAKGHGQTVTRVIETLEELGGDGVRVVERRGERRVVFDESAARRLERLGSSSTADGGGHDVVTDAVG